MSEPLVIIGNGMAAAKLVDELAAHALGRYAICVIGQEPRLAYNRVLLSSLLAEDVTADEIELKSAAWWRDRGVTLRYGCAAASVDPEAKTATLADGAELSFSKLVFATGSRPVKPPIPGIDLEGVVTFRDVDDVARMDTIARGEGRVVVIGGGLLGLEAAYGLAKKGARVTLLHLMDRLMERQLDAPSAALLKQAIEAKGVEVLLNANTARVLGDGSVSVVELTDGRVIAADAVVAAIGIQPNKALAEEAGLAVRRGIVVDDGMTTSAPDIFAIGECAEHRGLCCGLVEPVYEQAKILARRLAGREAHYHGSTLATNLKVSGVNVFSVGDVFSPDGEELVLTDPGSGFYKRLRVVGNRLIGAVLFGETGDGLWYLDLIRSRAPLGSLRDDLVFGRAAAERAAA